MRREEMDREFRQANMRLLNLQKEGVISAAEARRRAAGVKRTYDKLRVALRHFEASIERVADFAGPYIKHSDEN